MTHVLLVEDDPDDAELLLTGLQRAGVTQPVDVARDGAEALDYLFRRNGNGSRRGPDPALVVLDLKMPRVDGHEVLRRLKADPVLRRIPVVVFSSSGEADDIRACYDAGVNAYVVKPVDFTALLTAIGLIGRFWLGANQRPPA